MPKVSHGIVHFVETGEIHPSIRSRRQLKKQLEQTRKELTENIPNLTPQKEILINETMRCLGVLWLSTLYMNRHGIFQEGRLKRGIIEPQPFLKMMLSFSNSLRLNLVALGLDGNVDEKYDLQTYISEKYGEEKKKDEKR